MQILFQNHNFGRMVQSILFVIVTSIVFYMAYMRYKRVYDIIQLGKDEEIKHDPGTRWKRTLLIAFGQKKMFKRWVPAIFHLFIYIAFLFTQVELVEIILDGILGTHRFFAEFLGGLYTLIISSIEILSVLAFVATFVFLARRNLLKVPRLVKPEMDGWPKLDANLILIGELFLLIGIFTMNGTDAILQQLDPAHYPATGNLPISSWLGPALFGGLSQGTLVVLERMGWWLHLMVVYGFILYLPLSKHLHIFLSFFNVYYAPLSPRGEMSNMPEVMNEVKSMLGLVEDTGEPMSEELPEFGAKDITDLSWRTILGAYSCTECGRCTSVCPANLTGKKLSPRKIMMDIRDRSEAVMNIKDGDAGDTKIEDGNLFDYISKEELHACTSCNACVEACPLLINPLDPILQLRRYEILTESAGPAEWLPMFTSLENSGSVWQVPASRSAWTENN